MIYEEFYHLSKGSKDKLYFGTTKFFLCRYQSYQNVIRLIAVILFYIPALPLQPHHIMDVVLSHCKNRLEFTAHIFRNVPLSILQPLTQTLVEYTSKQINIIQSWATWTFFFIAMIETIYILYFLFLYNTQKHDQQITKKELNRQENKLKSWRGYFVIWRRIHHSLDDKYKMWSLPSKYALKFILN